MSEQPPTPPAQPPSVHLIDHTIIQSGVLFGELLRLYQRLSAGRKRWTKHELGRLQFRIELVCILSAAISPALRHAHVPIALRIIQLQVFCDMVTQTDRLALCEARPFLAFGFSERGKWLGRRLGLVNLARFIAKRKVELSEVAAEALDR